MQACTHACEEECSYAAKPVQGALPNSLMPLTGPCRSLGSNVNLRLQPLGYAMYDSQSRHLTAQCFMCWHFVIALQRLPTAQPSIPASLSDGTVHDNDGKRQTEGAFVAHLLPVRLCSALFPHATLLALTALPSAMSGPASASACCTFPRHANPIFGRLYELLYSRILPSVNTLLAIAYWSSHDGRRLLLGAYMQWQLHNCNTFFCR